MAKIPLKSWQEVCQRIVEAMGKILQVKKRDGRLAATGWNNEHFAVKLLRI